MHATRRRLDVGFDETRRFMNQIQQITNYWVLQCSFSIGVIDTIADKSTMVDIEKTINNAKQQVMELVRQGQKGELEIQPGKTMLQSFEGEEENSRSEATSRKT